MLLLTREEEDLLLFLYDRLDTELEGTDLLKGAGLTDQQYNASV